MLSFPWSSPHTRYFFVCLLLLCAPVIHHNAMATTWPELESDWRQNLSPALGIYPAFGRWNRTINLVYDPDNAPPLFSDPAHVTRLIEQAVSQWTHISGVPVVILPPDSGIINDRSAAFAQRDELVRI